MTNFWNILQPAVADAAVLLLTTALSAVGVETAAFLKQRKAKLTAEIGTAEYNRRLRLAHQIWAAVDEYFRITPAAIKTVQTATQEFEKRMKAALPTLTDSEIMHLHDVIAGIINAEHISTAGISTTAMPNNSASAEKPAMPS